MANQEAFTLDGLALNDGTTFGVDQATWNPPAQRQDWIGAADSEHQVLFRDPLYENRVVTLRVNVLPQASMDLATAKVAQVLDKLTKASKYTDGIGLVWTPATGTLSCTFDVLAGQITDLPIDWENGWLALAPSFTIQLNCKPYWRGTETLTSTTSSSTPFVTLEVANVTGDVPALGRLIITDTATQSRRHVEWGLEGPVTYNSGTSLLVDSDDMVTSGFSGTQTTATGAYDPNATGNSTVTLSPIAGATTAMAGTGNLSHVGVFRVKARVQSGSLSNLFRLSWRAADGPTNHNAWVTPISTAGWQELDLGAITVPAVTLGTQRWTGQVEVQGAGSSPGTVLLDYLVLVPQADGYGKARAPYSYTPGVVTGYDAFSATTAGTNLNTRTAPLGGAWATSGSSGTDFQFDDIGISPKYTESVSRTVAGTRFGVLGTATPSNVSVGAFVFADVTSSSVAGVLARFVDTSNYVVAGISGPVSAPQFFIRVVVAGTPTTLATVTMSNASQSATGGGWGLQLTVFASGRAVAFTYDVVSGTTYDKLDSSSSALATGGTLATGKSGIVDLSSGAGTTAWTNISIATPDAEPIAIYSGRSMQIRYDDTLRQDSTATYYGRPQSYRGSRFLIPVGTSRVLVKARRNDIETALDDQVLDATQIQVGWTPRGLAVPR